MTQHNDTNIEELIWDILMSLRKVSAPGHYKVVKNAQSEILNQINAHEEKLLKAERLRARIQAFKYLNQTYWDDRTDSIPCVDIDREIVLARAELSKLEGKS